MFYWYRLSIIVILRYKLQFLISFFLKLSVLSSKINVTFGRGLRLILVSKIVPVVFLCTYLVLISMLLCARIYIVLRMILNI